MSNRALRELRSLPLFQWEASARSSDFPARGDLLNMPTYDADMFSGRTRRLRSRAEGCTQESAQAARPPKPKAPSSTRKKGQTASKAKRRTKNAPGSAVTTLSQGKENACTGDMLPARNCLGPVTPGAGTPSAAAASIPFCPVTDPMTSSQDVAERRLFPEEMKVYTPQNKKHPDQCLSLEINSTSSTLTPVLNTPSVPGSCRPGISGCSTFSAQLHPNNTNFPLSHSHEDVRTAVTPAAISTARPGAEILNHEPCVSTRDDGTPKCAAHPSPHPTDGVPMSLLKPCEDAEQGHCTTSAHDMRSCIPAPCEPLGLDHRASPVPSGGAPESEVAPSDADNSIGFVPSAPNAAQAAKVADIDAQHHSAANSERIIVAQPESTPADPPSQQLSAANDTGPQHSAPPCVSQAVHQGNPLDLLASVAAGFTPADDTLPKDVAAVLTSLAAAGGSAEAAASADPAQTGSEIAVPRFKAPANDVTDDIAAGSDSPLSLLVSALTAHCNPNPAAAVEQPHSQLTVVQSADTAQPTSDAPIQPGRTAPDVSQGAVQSIQPSGTLNDCATDCAHAAPASPVMKTRSKSGASSVQQVAVKRPRSNSNPGSSPQQTLRSPVEKKTKVFAGEALVAQQGVVDAGLLSTAHPPVASLFKPSRKLDLFAPSPTLDPGSAWIVTWLP